MDFSTLKATVMGIVIHSLARGRVHYEAALPATQVIPNASWENLVWSGENYDTHSIGASGGTVLTVPAAGVYCVYASVGWANNNTGMRAVRLFFNDVEWTRAYFAPTPDDNQDYTSLTFPHYLPANATIKIEVWQSGLADITLVGGRVSVVRVSY